MSNYKKIDLANLTIANNEQILASSYNQKNIDKTIILKNGSNNELIIYILANSDKKISLVFKHEQKSKIKIIINAIVWNKSKLLLSLDNSIYTNISGCEVSQEINGLILDEGSAIDVLPTMIVKNNKVKASHSVNIGHLDKNGIYYLLSRNIPYQEAISILVKQMFYLDQETIYSMINRVLTKPNKL